MLWAVWLGLAVAILFQARLATMDEIKVPDTLLRTAEARLAEKGLRITFGTIECDTSGNILIKDAALYATTFPDPIATAHAVRFNVNPYALLIHKVIPRSAIVNGASLRVPAMYSPEGVNSALLDQIEAEVEFDSSTVHLNQLIGRFGNLTFSAHGTLTLPCGSAAAATSDADPLASAISAYIKTARQLADLAPRLEAADRPHLDITFQPSSSPNEIARVALSLSANSVYLGKTTLEKSGSAPTPARPSSDPVTETLAIGTLFATSQIDFSELLPRTESTPLAPPLHIYASISDAKTTSGISVQHAHVDLTLPSLAEIRTPTAPSGAQAPKPVPFGLSLELGQIEYRDVAVHDLATRVTGQYPSKLQADIITRLCGEPIALQGDVDLDTRSADIQMATNVTSAHLATLTQVIQAAKPTKFDITTILKPEDPIRVTATTHIAPGWKFTGASGTLAIGAIDARNVDVDRAGGDFVYDHALQTFYFTDAFAVTGESMARGSCTLDIANLNMRLLLKGVIRPLSISGWIGKWWPTFWDDFEFNGPPAYGDVDVNVNFKHTNRAAVFLYANASTLDFKTVPADSANLLLFIRPDFYDALELHTTQKEGYARGSFTHQVQDPNNQHLQTTVNFDVYNLFPSALAPMIGEKIVDLVAPTKFSHAPSHIKVSGRIDGPASPRGRHTNLDISVEAMGDVSYYDFPLTNIAVLLTIRDNVHTIEHLASQFADGRLTLKAQLSGDEPHQLIGFDATLEEANLGKTIQDIEVFSAARRGEPPPPVSKFQTQVSTGVLNVRMSANGHYPDMYSFKGNGSADVSGAELADINLFGALSRVLRPVSFLNFTSLHFNAAQANFTINGRELKFPDAVITGPRAKATLKGAYMLDTKTVNFNAKVYPLSESKNIIGGMFSLILTPVTHALELNLNGPLESPNWRLTYGGLRSFENAPAPTSETTPPSETTPATPPAPASTVPSSLRRQD